jgi:SRSO17 transposase
MCWESTPITALGPWTRGLLIRLVGVEGHRGAIEDSFETAKNELGSGHNETRSLDVWHRHVSLVMLTIAMMAAIRHHANRAMSGIAMSRS